MTTKKSPSLFSIGLHKKLISMQKPTHPRISGESRRTRSAQIQISAHKAQAPRNVAACVLVKNTSCRWCYSFKFSLQISNDALSIQRPNFKSSTFCRHWRRRFSDGCGCSLSGSHFGHGSDSTTRSCTTHGSSWTSLNSIIRLAVIIRVEKLLEPLNEFEIVLETNHQVRDRQV